MGLRTASSAVSVVTVSNVTVSSTKGLVTRSPTPVRKLTLHTSLHISSLSFLICMEGEDRVFLKCYHKNLGNFIVFLDFLNLSLLELQGSPALWLFWGLSRQEALIFLETLAGAAQSDGAGIDM